MMIVRGVRVFLAAAIAYAIPAEMLTKDITINTRDGSILRACDDKNITFFKKPLNVHAEAVLKSSFNFKCQVVSNICVGEARTVDPVP